MKINRFNENINTEINDRANIKSVNQYIFDFSDAVGENLIDWVSEISNNTKLKEYKKTKTYDSKYRKSALKFANDKKLENFKKYILIDNDIEKLEKEITKLQKHRDNNLYNSASSEVLYNFQIELLEKDFKSFYTYFMVENIEYAKEQSKIEYPIDIYGDIHPNIIKNIKYKQMIDINLDSMKYNL